MIPTGLLPWLKGWRSSEGDDRMCFAGIEGDVHELLQRQKLAESVAAKARVHAITSRVDHGHLHVLVEDRGWMRSSDLLQQRRDPGFEPVTRPLSIPRTSSRTAVSAGR